MNANQLAGFSHALQTLVTNKAERRVRIEHALGALRDRRGGMWPAMRARTNGHPAHSRLVVHAGPPVQSSSCPPAGAKRAELECLRAEMRALRREVAEQHAALCRELDALRQVVTSLRREAPPGSYLTEVVRAALRDQETVMFHALEGLAREVAVVRHIVEASRRPWWRWRRTAAGG